MNVYILYKSLHIKRNGSVLKLYPFEFYKSSDIRPKFLAIKQQAFKNTNTEKLLIKRVHQVFLN